MIPKAAAHPYGAMTAMAAVGTVQRTPEIVIVHDGKPVENVGALTQIQVPAGAGLVDECRLFVSPAVVGGGNRAFPEGLRLRLELVDERRFGNGVVYLRYRTSEEEP